MRCEAVRNGMAVEEVALKDSEDFIEAPGQATEEFELADQQLNA